MQINSIQNYGNYQTAAQNKKHTNFKHLSVIPTPLVYAKERLSKEAFSKYIKNLKTLHDIKLNLDEIMENFDIAERFNLQKEFPHLSKDTVKNSAKNVLDEFLGLLKDKEKEDYKLKIWVNHHICESGNEPTDNAFYGLCIYPKYAENHNVTKITRDLIKEQKLPEFWNFENKYYYIDHNGVNNYFELPADKEEFFSLVRNTIGYSLLEVIRNNLRPLNNQAQMELNKIKAAEFKVLTDSLQ